VLPGPKVVRVNPAARSYVNFPTRVWDAKAPPKTITVTASLDGTSVTTTAVRSGLQLSTSAPGTDEPASGQCANAGTVWHGPHGAPPCGLTFRQPGHFAVTASYTWRVSWQARGGTLAGPTSGPLHGGTFST